MNGWWKHIFWCIIAAMFVWSSESITGALSVHWWGCGALGLGISCLIVFAFGVCRDGKRKQQERWRQKRIAQWGGEP